MNPLTKYEVWYGRNCPPPDIVPLRAGTLTAEFEAGDLRYIRLGEVELVRRIYVGIRDHNWNTIPGALSDLRIDAADDHFLVTFSSSHRSGPLRFDWTAAICGASDGTITYAMDGIAGGDFRYCRMGFCVLHPIRECAGRPYHALTAGGPVTGNLPVLIEPQLMEGDFEAPLFPSCSALTVELERGLELISEFDGDLFEMEDQRNWTDGSFKTYCTPIALGYPHAATAGDTFHQKVTIKVTNPRAASGLSVAEPGSGEPARIAVGEASSRRLPMLGFGMASTGAPLTPREVRLLSKLRPAHLRLEVHLSEPDAVWQPRLRQAVAEARQIGTNLELALFLEGAGKRGLEALAGMLANAPLARMLVFHESEASSAATSPRWVDLVRERLGKSIPNVPIGGGTNGNFAELNRAYPDTSTMEAISFTINPQVHASDERSLVEALEPQSTAIETVRANCGPLPVWVSSVTLKPPFNQAATEEEVADPNRIPAAVDPRQMSLFAAAWTVGSIRSLAAGGADAITYFEAIGWRGLVETEQGSPMPDQFRSFPGMVFPVYHVFADLAEVADLEPITTTSSDPLTVQALALRSGDRRRVLVSNMLASPQRVAVGPLLERSGKVRRLNDETARLAMCDPARFRATSDGLPVVEGKLELTLAAYETICVDLEE